MGRGGEREEKKKLSWNKGVIEKKEKYGGTRFALKTFAQLPFPQTYKKKKGGKIQKIFFCKLTLNRYIRLSL